MLNLKIPNYYDLGKMFFGFADTLNPNADRNESQIVPKIVVLEKQKENKYIPIHPYEYHSIYKITPMASYMKESEMGWFISEGKIKEVIERTGLEEARVLEMDITKKEKVLKRAA